MKDINNEYTVETVKSIEEFKELKEDWERLYNLKGKIPIFFSFDVLRILYETVLKKFDNIIMKVLIVKNKRKNIIAILPFTFEKKIFKHFLPLRELSTEGIFLICYYYFLVDYREDLEKIFQTIIVFFKKKERNWDIIRFQYVPENEKQLFIKNSYLKKYYKYDETEFKTLFFDCNIDYDEYVQKEMRIKYVKDTKRQTRRLNKIGNLKLVMKNRESEIDEALDYLYDIEDKNWKGRSGTSLKQTYYGTFYRQVAHHFSKQENIRIYLLQLDDKYIAGLLVIIDRDICYLIKAGYDEDFEKISPLNVLYFLCFKDLFMDKKIKKIDCFGRFYPYEKNFGNKFRKCYNFTIYNNKIIPIFYYLLNNLWKKINQ